MQKDEDREKLGRKQRGKRYWGRRGSGEAVRQERVRNLWGLLGGVCRRGRAACAGSGGGVEGKPGGERGIAPFKEIESGGSVCLLKLSGVGGAGRSSCGGKWRGEARGWSGDLCECVGGGLMSGSAHR
jgi:hypothetical protein